jgi:hypothetical protein
MKLPTEMLDLGFAMGRIEESGDGSPMLTIVSPSCDGEMAQSVVISGWGTLEALGITLAEYCQRHYPERSDAILEGLEQGD